MRRSYEDEHFHDGQMAAVEQQINGRPVVFPDPEHDFRHKWWWRGYYYQLYFIEHPAPHDDQLLAVMPGPT